MSIQGSVNQVIGFGAALSALGKESAANRYKGQRELHSQLKRGHAAKEYPEVMKSLETNELMMDVQEVKTAPNSIADYNKLTKGVTESLDVYKNNIELDYDKERFNVEYSSLHLPSFK